MRGGRRRAPPDIDRQTLDLLARVIGLFEAVHQGPALDRHPPGQRPNVGMGMGEAHRHAQAQGHPIARVPVAAQGEIAVLQFNPGPERKRGVVDAQPPMLAPARQAQAQGKLALPVDREVDLAIPWVAGRRRQRHGRAGHPRAGHAAGVQVHPDPVIADRVGIAAQPSQHACDIGRAARAVVPQQAGMLTAAGQRILVEKARPVQRNP